MHYQSAQPLIEAAWEDRSLLSQPEIRTAIESVLEALDSGALRVAEPSDNGWQVNDWVKKAVILYAWKQMLPNIAENTMTFAAPLS